MTQLPQISLYNTLTRQKEALQPLEPGKIKMYVCGVTVYDLCHLGHARVMVVFDMITRYLRERGYAVTYVRNITDIDDKILKRAEENGEEINQLTERMIAAMHEDETRLGVLRPDIEPRATAHIDDILKLIKTLEDKGYAYAADNGDVYYRVRKFASYGQLTNRKLDDLQAGSRVEVDGHKEDPLDFVLWKAAKPGEASWPSPWGDGRPGWHIECSAMSTCCLGNTFDIHGGGPDLPFPHHENEIAQTWGADQRPLARYWMHAGYLNIEEQKMSKSLGNVLTVRSLLREHEPFDLRFLILSAHYRSPLNFSAELVAQNRSGRLRLQEMINNLLSALESAGDASGEREGALQEALEEAKNRFIEAMDDDFNTADGLGVLFDLARGCNIYLKEAHPYNRELLKEVIDFYRSVNGVFEVVDLSEPESLDHEILEKISRREEARAQRDFATADRIRDELLARGIILEDTPHGTRWKRSS